MTAPATASLGRSDPSRVTKLDPDSLELLDREDLLKLVSSLVRGGVALNFHGKRVAMEIAKRVRPRVTRRVSDLHVGTPEEQSKNLLIEGENLQAMVTLYKYRGQVDLVLADPPYNTGGQFRYNDRWDSDPNDPDLGPLVTMEDGSRHTKWMKAMMPRLQMMRSMLKPQGVIAICIDDNELFHLGMMMDEIFGEENRLAIINWQKTTSKNDSSHVARVTEYVLVYARDAELSATALLPPSAKAVARFGSPDGDPRRWKQGDLSAREHRPATSYGIQSPFTGLIHYPSETRHWANAKEQVREWLEEWNVAWDELDLDDGRSPAFVVRGYSPTLSDARKEAIVAKARKAATVRLQKGTWPRLYFGHDGQSRPMFKVHEDEVRVAAGGGDH